ncbi:MAG: DUF1624 domain-containing protein [Proteobacteria bacterium]|nr:DUF1624 domain-containing protein [Pseudomonadota bacterium]
MAPLPPSEPGVRATAARYAPVDALRGLAMVWMTAFHFCFDLSYFGYWQQDFLADPFWTLQRTAIVSLFLLCAGLGQAVAWHRRLTWPRFWRRWGQIVACALLVSAGSYLMFPRSFIYFGVLHGMALMLLVVRLSAGWGRWLWLAGLLALASPWLAAWALGGPLAALAGYFNGRGLNWIGWVTQKPFTEDYVPLFPWLGVMWWGMAGGQWLLARQQRRLVQPMPRAGAALVLLGRYSLSYYMLHQPVMIGALMLLGWLMRT